MGLMGSLATANKGGRPAFVFLGLAIASRDLSQRVKSFMVLVNSSRCQGTVETNVEWLRNIGLPIQQARTNSNALTNFVSIQ